MLMKTNILRIQAQGNCYCYRSHIDNEIIEQDTLEIQSYVESLDYNLIYAHPLLYANQQITVTELEILLSKGESINIKFQFVQQCKITNILNHICTKILKSLQFLPYRKINTYFNPFEEKNYVMSGLYLEPVYEQTYTGIAFLPVNLVLDPATQISSSKILLNYTNGKFYQRSEIVRVDKQKNIIHFRNGQTVATSNLRKGKLKDVSGLALAEKLKNYLERTKQSCKQFFNNWGIKLETNFFSSNTFLVSIGSVILRDNREKMLNQIVYPMAKNTYNHHFRQMFKDTAFEAGFEGQLTFLVPNSLTKDSKLILHEFEKLAQKMKLKLKLALIGLGNLQQRSQMVQALSTACRSTSQIYILITPKNMNANEIENVTYFKEQLINMELYFHIMTYDPEQEIDELDILVNRNMAIIYCKMRQNPWKITNIPFGNKPTMVCNINVQQTAEGNVSVALVGSMNALFSKFCCFYATCAPEKEQITIYNLLQQALNKFCSVHKIFPFRVFVFRTGVLHDIAEEQKSVQNRLTNYYLSIKNNNSNTLTYIQLKQSHPFRTFVQTDENYMSRQTVKKSQLLACTVISGRFYLQLEFDEPPMQIQIYEQENDQTFVPKVLQLLAKLCFGSVGNSFGKGLGFLGFAAKLNSYKQFNLAKWQKLLQEGVLLFL